MSYQVMARRHRPADFDGVVGQSQVVRTLVYCLNNGQLPHAILLSGSRGVGKTTLGRIIARCLSCMQGVSASACGKCDTCKALADGTFMDLLEVDAASRTQVEETRHLLETTQLAPTQGRYRIYLIDEVHMLSKHSFNALLKTLEEPPAHVFFLLATTEPQALPKTVLSRCLQFPLRTVSETVLTEHLHTVLTGDKIPFDVASLQLLATVADGSVRDALTYTEQAVAHGNGRLVEAEVADMLGLVSQESLMHLCRAVLEGAPETALAQVQALCDANVAADKLLKGILQLWHRMALGALVAQPDEPKELAALRALADAETVQLLYQITLIACRDLTLAPNEQAAVEMAVLRMLAYLPASLTRPATTDTVATPPSPPAVAAPVVHPDEKRFRAATPVQQLLVAGADLVPDSVQRLP